jgi:hypothetical protein
MFSAARRILVSPWLALAAAIGVTLLLFGHSGLPAIRYTALWMGVSCGLWALGFFGFRAAAARLSAAGFPRLASVVVGLGVWEVLGLLILIDILTGLLLHPLRPGVIDYGPTLCAAFLCGCLLLLQRKCVERSAAHRRSNRHHP